MSFKWNRAGLKNFRERYTKAIDKTAIDVLTDITSANVVPFDKGTLQKSTFTVDSKGYGKPSYIVWNTPYARRLYFNPEYNFRNGRRGRWADDWLKGSKRKKVLSIFAKNARKVM